MLDNLTAVKDLISHATPATDQGTSLNPALRAALASNSVSQIVPSEPTVIHSPLIELK